MAPQRPAPLDAAAFRRLFASAASWLDLNAPAVNALNVFPVPDGDTGTNMAQTLKAGVEAMNACPAQGAGEAAEALARGALLGARGNSGVILSQWLQGWGLALGGEAVCSGETLARALGGGADRAREAVSDPVEGTMLTIAREAAAAGVAVLPPGEAEAVGAGDVLAAAVLAARTALARTPELLPVLREAGVVDAGAQGMVLVLEAALASLRGVAPPPVLASGRIEPAWLSAVAERRPQHTGAPWGYCTEFIIQGNALSVAALREAFSALGTSLLVVGVPDLVRVHIHTQDPGAALTLATGTGSIHRIKIDNMNEQHAGVVAAADRPAPSHPAPRPAVPARAAVVAVVPGEGLGQVFLSMGAAGTVPGGQSMNPSAGELLEAVEAVDAPAVLLLPNNPNVIPAAQQVAGMTSKAVTVVPSRTVPQGLAALLSHHPDRSLADNAEAMAARLGSVRTVEVTQAVRDASIDGLPVKRGQYLGLVERRPATTGNTAGEALDRALDHIGPAPGYLVTLYYGAGVTKDEAQGLSTALLERPDTPEVEVVWGGQPHYQYIASIDE